MESEVIESSVELSFYESLHARHPEDWEITKVLADYYMEAKRYSEALALDKKIIAQFPEEALAYYNYACSLCRTNHLETALEALHQAVELGYTDWNFLLGDKDLFVLRQTKEFLKWAQTYLPGAAAR